MLAVLSLFGIIPVSKIVEANRNYILSLSHHSKRIPFSLSRIIMVSFKGKKNKVAAVDGACGGRSDVDRHMDGLLAHAIASSSLVVVQFLIENGAQPPNGARADSDTAELAKERGHAWVDMIDLAVTSETDDATPKADFLIAKAGYNGHVPTEWIEYATVNRKVGALELFLTSTSNYYTPSLLLHASHLHTACDTDSPDLRVIELLLKAGDHVDKVPKAGRPFAGEAPLHVATRRGSASVIELLRQHGANVNVKGRNFGRTALHLVPLNHTDDAAKQMELLRALQGAAASVKDKQGQTPLDCAIPQGHKTIITWLTNEMKATD